MMHKMDPLKGIPIIRFCDRLDGYVAGVQAMASLAKDLRIKEAIEAEQPQSSDQPVAPNPEL